MRLTKDGQLAIPEQLRTELGWPRDPELELAIERGALVVRQSKTPPPAEQSMIERLRGRGKHKRPTEELMKTLRGEP